MSDEKTLVNVTKVVFIDEITNERHEAKTSDEIDIEPIKSEGKRDILRVKNTIYGINQTDDIVIGYKLKMKDNLLNIRTMALIDGGKIINGRYEGTEAGKNVDRHLFTIEIYTEEKDYSRTIGYAKFTYKHCKGKPSKYKVKDGAFLVPEYEAESIPFRGEKPVEIEFLNSLDDESSQPGSNTDTTPEGGTVTDNNEDVAITVTSNIKWTFTDQINQDDVTPENFIVKKKTNSQVVTGNVTIDSTKKVVTFVPVSIERAQTYIAESKPIRKLIGDGSTKALLVEFTTIS